MPDFDYAGEQPPVQPWESPPTPLSRSTDANPAPDAIPPPEEPPCECPPDEAGLTAGLCGCPGEVKRRPSNEMPAFLVLFIVLGVGALSVVGFLGALGTRNADAPATQRSKDARKQQAPDGWVRNTRPPWGSKPIMFADLGERKAAAKKVWEGAEIKALLDALTIDRRVFQECTWRDARVTAGDVSGDYRNEWDHVNGAEREFDSFSLFLFQFWMLPEQPANSHIDFKDPKSVRPEFVDLWMLHRKLVLTDSGDPYDMPYQLLKDDTPRDRMNSLDTATRTDRKSRYDDATWRAVFTERVDFWKKRATVKIGK